MTGRRIVSIWLPHLAMERWQKIAEQTGSAPPDELPVVLACEGQHGPVVHAANRAARLAGAAEGARVVDARAVCPALRVEYGDPAGDLALLDRLVFWMRRWCPWSVRDGAQGLILDTTGSDHLWGGEAMMLTDMETRLAHLGLSARLAVAPTWGAAWALARFGPVRAICGPGDSAAHLAPLPVQGLRLTPDTLVLLRRLGLKTIGALAEAPRLSLTRRFARERLEANPQMRLDQALGKLAEPVGSVAATRPLIARVNLAEPVQDPTDWLPGLADDLCAQLLAQGVGARRVTLAVYRTDGSTGTIAAATSAPTRDPAHMARLFAERLAGIDPGFGFDLITLVAETTDPMHAVQVHLDGQSDDDLGLPLLLDRLAAKFGARAVQRPVLWESHVPERAERALTALADAPALAAAVARERPLRLLAVPEEVVVIYAVPEGPPARFVWRRQTHLIARYEGPERIAPEWWHDRPGTRLRDYFKIEDQRGRRLWLFREGLHGDGRGGVPRWFVHGMFA